MTNIWNAFVVHSVGYPFYKVAILFGILSFVTFFVSFLLLRCLFLAKITKWFCDKPDLRKVHSKPIPRFGGVIIVLTFLLFSSVLLFSQHSTILDISGNLSLALIFSTVIIFISGVLDDSIFVTVRARHKILAELLIGVATVYFFDIHFGAINLLNYIVFPLWFSKLVSVLFVMGLINAFNMVDGLDGLSGGVSLLAIMTLAVIACFSGFMPIIIICAILIGAILGFLYYNSPPASVFMGDTGSLFLGTMVGILSMYLGREAVPSRALIVMPLITCMPIIEVLLTMVRRYFVAKDCRLSLPERIHSMVEPDNSHIHHRLAFCGFTHLQSVILICQLSFIMSCGAICICLLKSDVEVLLVLSYLVIPMFLFLDRLGFGGRFKKALHLSKSRYNGFKRRALIGVVDPDGGALDMLRKSTGKDKVEYVSILEDELPVVCKHLRAVVVNKKDCDIQEHMQYAENASVLINGPVFVIKPEDTSLMFLEVYKNGTLNVKEKKGSINDLIREIKKVNNGKKWNYHGSSQGDDILLSTG
ncbi:MAG: MraY family glycosyltransferase, partial [Fibrobacter sp.]|nr:MraY family glycosyltransferase [Fibrobacter sp.]